MRAVALWALFVALVGISEAQLFPNSTAKYGLGNGTSSLAGNASTTSRPLDANLTTSSTIAQAARPSLLLSTGPVHHNATTSSGLWTNSSSPSHHSANNSSGLLPAVVTTPPYPANGTSIGLSRTVINSTFNSHFNHSSVIHNATNSTPVRPFATPLYWNSTSSRSFANTTSAPYSNATAVPYANITITTPKNACQQSYEDGQRAYFDFVPTTLTESLNTWILDYDNVTFSSEMYSCTKSCGTICYAGPITTIISTTHVHSERIYTYQTYERPFSILPNCTIPYDECIELQSSYTSASDYYWTDMPLGELATGEPIRPYCSACKSTACTFNQPYMELYYWPTSTTTPRDYCATAPTTGWASDYAPDVNHTYVPITTGTYAVVDGIKMYQGNVYVSYGEPRVVDNCGHSVPRQNTNTIKQVVTLASDAIYSIRTYPHILAPWPVTWDLKPYPVNYDDFHDPIPWSAWNGMRECAQEGAPRHLCTPIKEATDYRPYMMNPPQIRDLDPAWKTCIYDFFAAYDPPIALQPAVMFSTSTAVMANPTPTEDVQPDKTPATPGQNGGGWIPIPTARPSRPQSQPDWEQVRESVIAQPVGNAPGPTPGPNANTPIELPIEGITAGPSVIPVDSGGGLIVQPGLTLRPNGAPAEISGTTFSISSSSLLIIDNRGTSTIALPQTNLPQSFITIGPSNFPIDSNGNVLLQPGIPGITLTSNGNALNINGTMMTLGAAGMILTHNGQTTTIPTSPHPTPQTALTLGPSTYLLAPSGALILRPPQTLHPTSQQSQLIISGTTYILSSTFLILINSLGAKTYSFTSAAKQYITVGTQTYTLVNGKLVLGPQVTLSGVGGMAIFQGTTVMLRSGGVVVESRGGIKSTVGIVGGGGDGNGSRGGKSVVGSGTRKSSAAKMERLSRGWCMFVILVFWVLVG